MLENFIKRAEKENLGVYGICVHKDGEIKDSHYFRVNNRVHIFSGSKTFTAVAIGIAKDAGLLRLEDKVLDFFPEYKEIAAAGSEVLTIRNLLLMRSGHKEAYVHTNEDTWEPVMDWAEKFFREPFIESGPASAFMYENECTYVLGRIIAKVTGQNLRDYLTDKLFEPLGIQFVNWNTCPKGYSIAAFGLYLKTSEFMKLGVMLLNGGIYEGQRIVSEAYVNEMKSSLETTGWDDIENEKYGFQVWSNSTKLDESSFRADGLYGQYTIVLPKFNAVIGITSHNENRSSDILQAVWDEILPLW